jgi:maltose alpha-D-glucosyltransferase/alpha-amylase
MGLAAKTRTRFEAETLPRYIEAQRWYASKGSAITRATLADHVVWEQGSERWLLPLVELEGPAQPSSYFVPLALAWEERDEERMRGLAVNAVARVRQQAQVGVMGDAFADEPFCRALLEAIGAGTELKTERGGRLLFKPTASFRALAGDDLATRPIERPKAQSSNTIVMVDELLFLKGCRRLRTGINPELEIGRYLTDVAGFEHCAPLAGWLEHVDADGTPTTLALVQGYVPNQGDGWNHAVGYLSRYFELRRSVTDPEPPDVHGGYLTVIEMLGRRTAELHLALARKSGDPAFDPEPLTGADLAATRRRIDDDLGVSLDLLQARAPQLPPLLQNAAQALLSQRTALQALIAGSDEAPRALKTRHHGDYHLGQVLLAKNDFIIIDFEGEPGRSLEERRAKHSPLRDVAGMLRSFSYAAHVAMRSAASKAEDLETLAPAAEHWRQQARAAFLRAYDAAAGGSGLYESLEPGIGLLGLFELEKALYELRYELNNRPDWVGIPLQGLLDLLSAAR